MRPARSRPFTVIDAMILIAAMAIGLGGGIALHRFVTARAYATWSPLFEIDRAEKERFRDLGEPPPTPLPSEAGPVAEPSESADAGLLPPPLLPWSSPWSSPSVTPEILQMIRHTKVQGVVTSAAVFLASWTLGLLVLRLRRPRPPLHRLALRPGSAALIAVLFSATFHGATVLAEVMGREKGWPSRVNGFIEYGSYRFGRDTGPCVVLIWAVLALGRRWRVRGWIEWSGLVLGAFWILIYLANSFAVNWIVPL